MTIPKEAIERAIEGGWDGLQVFIQEAQPDKLIWQIVALQPTFWQALAKAMKYDQPVWLCESSKIQRVVDGKELGPRCEDTFCAYAGWKNLDPGSMDGEVHRFYDLILTNGDTDAFWKELLAPKE